MSRRWMEGGLLGVWLSVVALGYLALFEYGNRPGDPGDTPATWPAELTLQRDAERPTLVMAIHPRCSCSRASLGELARLMATLEDRVVAHAVVWTPADARDADSWTETDLWTQAEQIPGVQVVADPGGALLEALGARTSGHVVLYGPDGDRWFTGGITPSRAHMGDSVGRHRILARVLEGRAGRGMAAVYGCGLSDAKLDNQLMYLASLAARRLVLWEGT